MINQHQALIYTMILVSAVDRRMGNAELKRIGGIVKDLPVFKGFDTKRLTTVARACARALDHDDGLARVLDEIARALPKNLRETAYALACDIAAIDRSATREELRLLEMIRDRLSIERLVAAAIERGARARHAVL